MGTDEGTGGSRLRIGELAELADTTPRAIRHYHSSGLLAEPRRDGSGYRRYGAEELVELMRIRRLRALGMPIEQIAAHLSGQQREAGDLPAALRALADDIARQIGHLKALRTRVLDIAASSAVAAPVETWSAALRRHDLLDGGAPLPPSEHAAVELLDALHPDGIDGVIAQASPLLADPAFGERLGPLLQRFRELPADAGETVVEELAAAYAELLPRPDILPPAVDLGTMEKLLGDRLTDAQMRCLRRVRGLLEARDR